MSPGKISDILKAEEIQKEVPPSEEITLNLKWLADDLNVESKHLLVRKKDPS